MLVWLALAHAGGRVEGHVFDDEGVPREGVDVQVGGQTVQTDARGGFDAEAEAGDVDVRVGNGHVSVRVSDGGATEVLVTLGETVGFLVEQPETAEKAVEVDTLVEVSGRITGPDGAPVDGVRVFARGVQGMARTDADGRVVLAVPPGEHTLVVVASGFASAERVVTAGEVFELELEEAARALAAYTVTAPYLAGSVAGLLDARKDGSAVADVLGADEMKRSGDGDAAAALSRVTGLTVVGGKYVFVRGLGDRYSSSLFNGGALPSPEPERRVVPLDLFPTSVLSGVIVQKSWSPDMPGEFGGGVIQLETVDPPTGWTSSVGISGGGRWGTTFTRGPTNPAGFMDVFGVDGGNRALPESVANASAASPLEEGDLFSERGYSAEELEKFGEAMPSRYSPEERVLPPAFGLSASVGNGFERDGAKGGVLAAFTFGNSWQRQRFNRVYYVPGEAGVLRPQHNYNFDEVQNDVSFGGFLTGGLTVGKSTFKYTGMLSRSTDNTARIYEGYNDDVGGDIRVTRLRWVERQLGWNQLKGTHDLGKLEVKWHGIYSGAGRIEPDRTETRYDNEPGTDRWLLSDRPEGNGRFFSDSSEQTLEANVDFTYRPWRTEDRDGPAFKVGSRVTTRRRGVDTRRFKYFHKGEASRDQDILTEDPNDIFVPDNIGANGFQFEEFTRQTDNYGANHTILAAYADTLVPVTPWLTVTAGARIEKSQQDVETFELFNPDQVPVVADLGSVDLLPAGTVTLAPTEKVRVRFGAARTVSRPDFRELSPATFNDVTGGRQTFGNPELGRAKIDHFDARLEWFPRSGEVLSVGGFAKRFTDPVETVVVPSAQQSVTWENAKGATNVGVELEARRSLPANFWCAGNVALIRSRVEFNDDSQGIQTSDIRALQGQSPWVANFQGGWEHPDRGDRVTVLFNAVGQRITEVGALGAPDIVERPAPSLDLVARKDLGSGLGLGLEANNILDGASAVVQGSETVQTVKRGWSLGVSLGWSAR